MNSGWSAAATANGAPQLAGEAVIGRPLRAFVSGDMTRMFVDSLLQTVRLTARQKTIGYRCDSPDMKRYMEMRLEPVVGGGVALLHRVLREEAFVAPVSFTVAGVAPGTSPLKRCSMCNRLVRAGGALTEPDRARAAGWFDPERPTPVIYFVCADCRSRLAAGWVAQDSHSIQRN